MISPREAKIISELFYIIDTNVRNDLYRNLIADERDYVSRLATHFNYPFGIFNKFMFEKIKFHSKWFSKVNSGHHERKFGCDGMIVFRVDNKIKVGLFEAKWPRVIKDQKYQWDYTQKSTKTSHFTNQILRQSKWTSCAAIWEMFFYEQKVGVFDSPFDKNASSCIKHEYANALVTSTPSLQTIWNNDDLITLISSAQTSAYDGTNEANIEQIIYDILTCSFGNPIDISSSDKTFILKSIDGNESASCPIISMSDDKSEDQYIEGFMTENGLSFFQQLDISTSNETHE